MSASISRCLHCGYAEASILHTKTDGEGYHAFQGPPPAEPIPMLLWCPECSARHIDVGDFATKPHHTHACQDCGMVWRPAIVPTCGVLFLPGFKNGVST